MSSLANLGLVCSPSSCSYHHLEMTNLGKSCFLYYALFHCLCNQKSTAFQVSGYHLFVVFEASGVKVYDARIPSPNLIPEGSWALADTDDFNPNHTMPCNAFLMACSLRQACVIQASSPNESLYQPWTKKRIVIEYFMDSFSKAELITLGWVKSP